MCRHLVIHFGRWQLVHTEYISKIKLWICFAYRCDNGLLRKDNFDYWLIKKHVCIKAGIPLKRESMYILGNITKPFHVPGRLPTISTESQFLTIWQRIPLSRAYPATLLLILFSPGGPAIFPISPFVDFLTSGISHLPQRNVHYFTSDSKIWRRNLNL